MTTSDCILTQGSTIWDFSQYAPHITWGYVKDVMYFKFPGTPDPKMIDLLDNENTISISIQPFTSLVTTQLNPTSTIDASLRLFLINVKQYGTDPNGNLNTLTTLKWGDFGTFTVCITNVQLTQNSGEGDLYGLEFKMYIVSGPV